MTDAVDALLEARFRHILQDEKWIPKVIRPMIQGGGNTPPVQQQKIPPQKIIGVLLIVGAAVGLLVMWCRNNHAST